MIALVLRGLFLCYAILFPLFSSGQLVPRGYLEIDVSSSHPKIDFTIVPARAKGIVLVGKTARFTKTKRDWEIIMLDTGLNKSNIGTLKLQASYDLVGHTTNNEHVFLLFDHSEWSTGTFQLIKLNLSDHSVERFDIKHASDLSLTHFSVAGNSILFGGQIMQRAVVLLYNMPSKKLIAAPGFFNKRHQLLDLRVNENNTFSSLTIEENVLRTKFIVTKVFSQKGHLLLKDSARVPKKTKILSGMISGLKRDDLMAVGTYTKPSSRRVAGFYSLPINPLNNQSIRYFPLSLLHHFLDYMGEEKAIRLREKEQSRVDAGKETVYSAAYIFPVRLQEERAGFFLSAEMLNGTPISSTQSDTYSRYRIRSNSYIPFYTTPSHPSRYSRPSYLYDYRTDNELEYTQSVIAFFNAKGELVWDTSINMKLLKYTGQSQVSDFIVKGEAVWLAYKKENELFVNINTDSAIRLDTLEIPSSDAVLHEYSDESGVQKWYGDYFFAWGYRDVKYATDEERRNHVLYIAKFGIQ